MNLHGKLLALTKELNSGIHPDKHPVLNYVWENASNVRFNENGVRPVGGWYSNMTELDLIESPRGGGWWRNGGDMVGMYGNYESLYLITCPVGSTTITTASLADTLTGSEWEVDGVNATTWSVCQWGTWRLVTNGVDELWRWNSVDGLDAISDIADVPKILLTQGAHVLAFNFLSTPNRFGWCSADDVEVWATAPDNSAGDLDIREFSNGITAATYLGESIAVYSDNQMAIVNYLGAPFYYGYEVTISEGVGAFSMNSVFSVGGLNYGVCRNGFFKTDGATYQYIGQGTIWETFKDELNLEQTSLIHGYHLELEQELWWWYPVGEGETNPSKAIVYNYALDNWTFIDVERSGSLPPTDIEYPLAISATGAVYFHEYGDQEVRADYLDGPLGSYPIQCWVETKPLTLNQSNADGSVYNAEHKYKYIQAVLLHVHKYEDMGLTVRVGVMDDLKSDAVFWSDPFPDDLVFPLLSGRYIKVRIEANTTRTAWELHGMDIHGKITGNYR